MDTGKSSKLYWLWFLAAGLAFLAAAITYFRKGEVNAMSMVLGLVGVAMGYMNWSRNRVTSKPDVQD
jgi:hypothetical protein